MAQQAFGFRSGFPRVDGFPVSFISLSNADITITCNGFTKTLTSTDWVEVGADHPTLPRLGYIASTVVTGQTVFTRHPYTVAQNGTTYDGSAMSAARRGDDFSIFFDTCRNNAFTPESPTGSYGEMKDFNDAGGVIQSIAHVDDHYGYMDLLILDDTAGTGHASTGEPATTELEYDYAMGLFAAFGLFVNDTGGTYARWGQYELNIWAMRMLNVIPQEGDHDAGGDEMGWYGGLPALRTGFVNAKRLWDLFMGPLQPPSLSNRAVANHCGGTLGALTMVFPDGITLGTGDAIDANIAIQDYGPTNIYSIAQIYDCLDGLNTDAPFKMGGFANSMKFLAAPTKYFSGAQNPIKNANLAEYQAFMTAEDDTINPLSIMANPQTNGVLSSFIACHGDDHINLIAQHQSPAYAGNHAENFFSFNVGTGNGSVNFGIDPSIDAGTVYDGSTVHVAESASKGLLSNGGGHWWSLRIDIKDSVYPPQMTVTDKDRNGSILWSKAFVQTRGGNYAFDSADEVTDKSTSSYNSNTDN